jgi:Flp pilus assembly protein TadG
MRGGSGHLTMSSPKKWYLALRLFSGVCFSTTRRASRLRVRRAESGQAAVEMAIVLPVLLLILFGIIKFGIVYSNYIQLTTVVDSGARQLAIERGQQFPCTDTGNVIDNSTSLTASQLMVTMYQTAPGTTPPAPTPTPAGAYTWETASTTAGTCPTLSSGSSVTVNGTYPADLKILGIQFYTGLLSVTVTEDVE